MFHMIQPCDKQNQLHSAKFDSAVIYKLIRFSYDPVPGLVALSSYRSTYWSPARGHNSSSWRYSSSAR